MVLGLVGQGPRSGGFKVMEFIETNRVILVFSPLYVSLSVEKLE